MPPLIDCAAALDLGYAETSPIVYERGSAPTWPRSANWPGHSVSRLVLDHTGLNCPFEPRVLTDVERIALDRALWRSVQVLDNGFE